MTSDTTASLRAARRHERRMLRAVAHKHFVPLGVFVSAAPRTRLLAVLRQLKPQLDLRLHAVGDVAQAARYRVEVDARDLRRRHEIDVWLGIKGALTSAFPANKPGAVRRLQP